jgi:CheY-like chemotaxis protein
MVNFSLGAREAATLDLAPGDYVRVDVIDTGVGMESEVLARVFEPFFTTKEVGKGSGLGLAQVHGFTRQSGGAASLRSTPGQGTVVSLFFPRATSMKPENVTTKAPSGSFCELPSATVLVVEDEPDVLEVTQLALSDAGHRVLSAQNGVEALELLRSDIPVDMMVSDVILPGGISGVEIAREARRLRPELPVLLTSGYAGAVLAERGIEGEFELLSKPYSQAELLRWMAKAMLGRLEFARKPEACETG